MVENFFERLLAPLAAVADLVEAGGIFVYFIFLCGMLLWTLILERIWFFNRILPQQASEMLTIWKARTDHKSWCARQIRQMMISKLNSSMTTNFPMLRTLVPMAPLLGLIGTVSGMLEVFDSMALRGAADARTMASGVSHAMVCTLTGLAVSITGLYPIYYFTTRVRRETETLADHFDI